MTDLQKLQTLIDHYAEGSRTRFADMIGVPHSTITTWMFRKAITAKGRERILETFPDINRQWLIHSATNMIERQPATIAIPSEDSIPYYEDLPGTCGVAEQFSHPEYATDTLYIPGIRALAALPAQGDSMHPVIQDGDTVIIGHATSLASATSQGIYLIITTDGNRMFKRIQQDGISSRHILAVSDNPDYTPRAAMIDKRSILALHPVLSIVRRV